MKKILNILLTICILAYMTGCTSSNSNVVNAVDNPLVEKIYLHNTPLEKTFDFEFIKFYDDNTFQGIHSSFKKNSTTGETEPNYTSYYGTYSIEKNALTLNISNDSFAGVIIQNSDSIKFGNDEFIDYTANISDTDSLLIEFN